MEHRCSKCGFVHEDQTPAIWLYRCSNCGALDGEVSSRVSKATCRICDREGTLVALDSIPDVLRFYPGLRKTERGYEGGTRHA